jgi:hypothetical protein
LAIAFLLFQGINILVSLDKLIIELSQEPQYLELMERYEIQEGMLEGSLRATAFFWLALAAWIGYGIFQMSASGGSTVGGKEKKAFWHFLIPSILALITGRWDAGICGIIASVIYRKRVTK